MYHLTIKVKGNKIESWKEICWLDALHEIDQRERKGILVQAELEIHTAPSEEIKNGRKRKKKKSG